MGTSFSFYNHNSAKNAPLLEINGVRFYFSYSTCVAVRYSGGLVVRQNVWGTTTGKHLNWIYNGDKKERVSFGIFASHLQLAMKEAGVDELPSVDV